MKHRLEALSKGMGESHAEFVRMIDRGSLSRATTLFIITRLKRIIEELEEIIK